MFDRPDCYIVFRVVFVTSAALLFVAGCTDDEAMAPGDPTDMWQQIAPVGEATWDVVLIQSFAADDAYFVGVRGDFRHYDGQSVHDLPSLEVEMVSDLWGTSGSDLYLCALAAGTERRKLFHFDGDAWQQVSILAEGEFRNVWGSSADDVFVGGHFGSAGDATGIIYHFDGEEWTEQLTVPDRIVKAIHGTSPNSVFAIVGGYALYRYDGESWGEAWSSVSAWPLAPGILSTSPTNVLFAKQGDQSSPASIYRFDGSGVSVQATFEEYSWLAIWRFGAASSSDVYAASAYHLFHYDGAGWSEIELEGISEPVLTVCCREGHGTFIGCEDGAVYWRP